MHTSQSTRVVSILVLICVLAAPAVLESQCAVSTTIVNSSPPTIQIFKILSNSYSCGTTAMNASFCSPTAATFGNFLQATAMTATVAPFCNWSCAGCPGAAPHVAINSVSDGLPVELMDFGFEDEASAEE